jgi:hypothetical protein
MPKRHRRLAGPVQFCAALNGEQKAGSVVHFATALHKFADRQIFDAAFVFIRRFEDQAQGARMPIALNYDR